MKKMKAAFPPARKCFLVYVQRSGKKLGHQLAAQLVDVEVDRIDAGRDQVCVLNIVKVSHPGSPKSDQYSLVKIYPNGNINCNHNTNRHLRGPCCLWANHISLMSRPHQ